MAELITPKREVVELDTAERRVIYVVEPVAAASLRGPQGVRDHTVVGPRTDRIQGCGTTGAWTQCPSGWQPIIGAAVGHIVTWTPAVLAAGPPAALDLAAIVNGAPVRYASTGTATPAPLGHGGMYSQGDWGTVRLPTLHWVVRAGDLHNGLLTLALMYRNQGGTNTFTIGHPDAGSYITATNLGPVAGTVGEDSGAAGSETSIWLGSGSPTVMPENYHRVHNIAIDVTDLTFYELDQ